MRGAVQRYANGQLTSTAEPASQPVVPVTSQPGPVSQRASQAATVIAITGGEPSTGVLCMDPGCLERNTRRFGLRRLPLCPACTAALEDAPISARYPESAARAIRRGAT